MDYLADYKCYRDELLAQGAPRHIAEKLAKDLALNWGQLSPHLWEYVEAYDLNLNV